MLQLWDEAPCKSLSNIQSSNTNSYGTAATEAKKPTPTSNTLTFTSTYAAEIFNFEDRISEPCIYIDINIGKERKNRYYSPVPIWLAHWIERKYSGSDSLILGRAGKYAHPKRK